MPVTTPSLTEMPGKELIPIQRFEEYLEGFLGLIGEEVQIMNELSRFMKTGITKETAPDFVRLRQRLRQLPQDIARLNRELLGDREGGQT